MAISPVLIDRDSYRPCLSPRARSGWDPRIPTMKSWVHQVGRPQDTGRIINTSELEVQNLPTRAKWVARENMLRVASAGR